MKVRSIAPYDFRRVKLAKGESDFDIDKLDSKEKKYFDGLVKAKVVEVFDGEAPKPHGAGPAASSDSPENPPVASSMAPVSEDVKPKTKRG